MKLPSAHFWFLFRYSGLTILLLLVHIAYGLGQTLDYSLEKLGSFINTPYYHEISPVLSDDGRKLFYTRTGSPDFIKDLNINGENIYKQYSEDKYLKELAKIYQQLGSKSGILYQSPFNQDVWVANSNDGNYFTESFHPGYPLNNALPNSVCSFTPNDDEYVIINQFPSDGGMKKGFSTIKMVNDSTWLQPIPLNIPNLKSIGEVVSLTMSKDGSVVILSLNREDSKGDNDLYVSQRTADSSWTEPINLGNVNSGFRDITPYLTSDMLTLYFSSNRPGSMGGFDIFMSKRSAESWTQWSEPLALISPINSSKDDLQPHFNTSSGFFFFSSKRDGTSDLFRVKISELNSDKVTVLGRVVDSKTLRPVSASIYIGLAEKDNYQKVIPSADGDFTLVVERKSRLKIFPFKEKYLSHEEILSIESLPLYANTSEVTIYVDPKAINTRISSNPIYFQQSKALIIDRSYQELDRLVRLLLDNPSMNIKVEGHTDNLGKSEELQLLSEQRANTVRDYLIAKKINPVRISTVGFGARRPINANNSQELRELNRRVEFIITKI